MGKVPALPLLRRPAHAPYFHPFFLFFRSPPRFTQTNYFLYSFPYDFWIFNKSLKKSSQIILFTFFKCRQQASIMFVSFISFIFRGSFNLINLISQQSFFESSEWSASNASSAQVPEFPSAQMPECPSAQMPECPSIQVPWVPVCPSAWVSKYPSTSSAPVTE